MVDCDAMGGEGPQVGVFCRKGRTEVGTSLLVVTHGFRLHRYVSPPKVDNCVQESTVRCPFTVFGEYVNELVGGSYAYNDELSVGDKIFQGEKTNGQVLALVSGVRLGGKVKSSLGIGEDGGRLNRLPSKLSQEIE